MQQLSPLFMSIAIFVIFYFLLIRPQQKRNKKIQEMRKNLKNGDHIITIGGIHGKIIKIKDDVLTIEVGADKVRLQIERWAVGSVKEQKESL
ncbi:protein translocase subunit yajC [Caminicella sporogenes DSM 14501]|uniref:Protein translocase subunit yajC n=2 Tax=Caminicella TaxID=166484 RepID=A0A1M6M1V7_9FIRM|nr:preprotein translocase subunit YajC [Caminicella sporogenes]WIF94363.1 preprotein translocase subunit YajC [Caminicella sporogenes]SHJ77323.1 protein translocase subunit yajC [Caminicella sporogenes DSM 14501]